MVILGSSKGTLIALDAGNGRERWRVHVNSELLSAPAISEKVVVLRSVDGRLHGLDSASGKELWQLEQQVPRLSLRGTATPIIAKEMAISGFDNGKVMAVSLTTRDTGWGKALAAPPGPTQIGPVVGIDPPRGGGGGGGFAAGFL